MLESIASPLAALTVNGFFREHCVPLVGTIATRFPLLESLIIRGCDRMLQEMIFRVSLELLYMVYSSIVG
jgi:hypothetical protein